ncbi:myogenesis-regulating glycosidase-like [Dysidea avara]|uniref:myogenesis-regulating glycosidase-like n=1 Tax=Dysidea avara TaxID=196820 RepID=UPI00331940F0
MRRVSSDTNSDDLQLSAIQEEDDECEEEEHPLAELKDSQKFGLHRVKDILSKPLVRKVIVITLISLLFLGCFLFVVLPLTISDEDNSLKCTGDATHLFNPNTGEFALCHRGKEKIRGRLGDGYVGTGNLQLEQISADKYVHGDARLELSYQEAPNNREDGCLSVKWRGPSSQKVPLRDCYNLSEASWFAGHTPNIQSWPLNTSINMTSFLPIDSYNNTNSSFGSVLHPIWLSTRGAAVFVNKKTPLHVSLSQTELCIQSLPYPLLCSPPDTTQITTLEYRVCGFVNVKDAAVHFLDGSEEVNHPSHTPHMDLFKYPIWSTWVRYKENITQDKISMFLNEILSHNFTISNFEIDDRYSTEYGTVDFDPAKFDDVTSFTRSDDVVRNNVAITTWVHPFVDYSAADFTEGLDNLYFYPGGLSRTEALVRWWNGVAAVINFEDDHAKNWFRNKLNTFRDNYGVASFKFDAGEINYLPECLYYPSPEQNSFTAQYAQFAASIDNSSVGSRAEVRVGHFTQDLPIMVRMIDRDTRWGLDNGLHSVIVTALSMGLMGYPFILPDMIGGNNYNNGDINAVGAIDDVELYIRWMQLVTFLPSMQFSIPPWDLEEAARSLNVNIVEYARRLVHLHTCMVDAYVKELAVNVSSNGYPIIRPLWWMAADDPEAVTVNDQFLIGDSVMIAPVIRQGARSRDVYFPEGTWKLCYPPYKVYEQGLTHSISADLTTVLWFTSTGDCKCTF